MIINAGWNLLAGLHQHLDQGCSLPQFFRKRRSRKIELRICSDMKAWIIYLKGKQTKNLTVKLCFLFNQWTREAFSISNKQLLQNNEQIYLFFPKELVQPIIILYKYQPSQNITQVGYKVKGTDMKPKEIYLINKGPVSKHFFPSDYFMEENKFDMIWFSGILVHNCTSWSMTIVLGWEQYSTWITFNILKSSSIKIVSESEKAREGPPSSKIHINPSCCILKQHAYNQI